MRILSISGGGFQALYGVRLLAQLEARIGPLSSHFGLFCGTSAGAIVASAAACGMPMAELEQGFLSRGAQAFQPRRTGLGRDILRRFRTAKYHSAPLAALIADICGEHTLAHTGTRLAITATRLRDGAAVLFTGPDHPDIPLRDAVLASAAAPIMFPAVPVAGELYADGALFANAPDLLAYAHAVRHAMADPADLSMLSLGSMNGCPPLHEPHTADMGVLDWMRGNRIFRTMIGAQADMTASLAGTLMGPRYTRIDADPCGPAHAHVGLDKTSPLAVAATLDAACVSWPMVERWMVHNGF